MITLFKRKLCHQNYAFVSAEAYTVHETNCLTLHQWHSKFHTKYFEACLWIQHKHITLAQPSTVFITRLNRVIRGDPIGL
jgi:hypothetical protein